MTRPAARFFTRLHSRQWRNHYGDEFEALLLDVPVSASVVVDVALSICASRQGEINVAAVVIAIVLVSLMVIPHQHATARMATVQTVSRVSAQVAPPCRTYSSVARSQFIQPYRCLD